MSATPTISVVVPTYNHEAFVSEALESVAAQTYRGPIELIVLDDASSDGTLARAEACAASIRGDRRWSDVIVVGRRENRGAHATINEGILRSTGRYVTVLNSDDRYTPDRLDVILRAMTDADSEFGFSLASAIGERGAPIEYDAIAWQIGEFAIASASTLPTIEFAFLRHQIAISTGNMVFTRRLFDAVGGFSPLRYCHDWDFALTASLFTHPTFVQRRMYEYRIHGTNSFASLGHLAGIESEAVLRRYFRRVLEGVGSNERAATPRNWPGVFEHYLARFGVQSYWNDATATLPRYALR